MKHHKCLLILSAAILATTALADTIVYDDVTYTIDDATVSPVRVSVGTGVDDQPAVNTTTEFTLEIPSAFTAGGVSYQVTRIGDHAFKGCGNLKGVTIPDTVTSIGSYAFQNSGLTSVVIPGSVESVGSYAFSNCNALEIVTLHEGVLSISSYAFAYSKNLKHINFPNGLRTIGVRAFQQCYALSGIALPESLTDLAQYAFRFCSSLHEVTIPQQVDFRGNNDNTGKGVFSGCSAITNAVIKSARIPDDLFAGADSKNMAIETVVIHPTVTSIGNGFGGCWKIKCVNIPQVVVDLGVTNVFRAASESINDITLSTNVTSINEHTFEGCVNLRRIVIPDSVTSIEEGAFSGLANLEEVTIPPNVTGLNAATFSGCDRLWSRWYRSLADGAYDLSGTVGDKKIASISVDGDASLDSFVLRDGKVYDALVVVENKSANAVALTLPRGFRYLTPAGRKPLHLPANSMNLLTITRVSDDAFLVTRQKLQDVE